MSRRLVCAVLATSLCAAGTAARAASPIEFLGEAEAADAIVDDGDEPYFARLQPLELRAKCGDVKGRNLERRREACRETFRQSALAFSPAERQQIQATIASLSPLLEEHYPLVAETPWRIAKVDDSIEGALPHTRGETIILSRGIIETLIEELSDEDRAVSTLSRLLLHEKLHVIQRRIADRFEALYVGVLGFERIAPIEEGEWLTRRRLLNPDGLDRFWVWPVPDSDGERWIWPTVILDAKPSGRGLSRVKMPRDIRMIAVTLDREGDRFHVRHEARRPVYESLHQVDAFADTFRHTTAAYHPHEITAAAFPDIVFADLEATPTDLASSPTLLDELRPWFRANLRD